MDKCTQRTLAHVKELQAGFGRLADESSQLSPREPLPRAGKGAVGRAVLMTQGVLVDISKFRTARSRLYQSQILQVNI